MYKLLIVLLLTSCATTRETAKAVIHADIAATAITKSATSKEVAGALSTMSESDKAIVIATFNRIVKLSQSINYSLAPAITQLEAGEQLQVETTVEEAIENTDTFVAKSMMQSGKAQIEVQKNESNRKLLAGLVDIGTSLINSSTLVSGLMTGGGVMGLLLAFALKNGATIKRALSDQIEYTKAVQAAPPDISEDELVQLQKPHIAQQKANGTHDVIKNALAQQKAST